MKPRFEEHEGKLFRMLEEPEPLTSEATLPCVVRLIQDDSPMGRYNRDAAFFDVTGKLFIAQKIKENPLYRNTLHAYEKRSISHDYCIASIHTLEVIGYPVAEGSHWWALYQMMQGEKVCNPTLATEKAIRFGYNDVELFNTFWYIVGDDVVEGKSIYGTMSVSSWIAASSSTGWQIYEPKPEPAKEPKTTFKVGDWVRGKSGYAYEITAYPSKLLPDNPNVYDAIPASCMYGQSLCLELSDIESKLDPSEVVLDFGSGIKGWIRRASNHTIEVYSKANCWLANIRYDMLDTETRKLIESLLKAQEEEK